jgi:hypothetical protein
MFGTVSRDQIKVVFSVELCALGGGLNFGIWNLESGIEQVCGTVNSKPQTVYFKP